MFIANRVLSDALLQLEDVHPFYGITFLVFKKGQLPVGELADFPIDTIEREFMNEHYRPFPESEWYYRVFRPTNKDKAWLDKKYPGAGSQSTRTRGKKAAALIHQSDTTLWAWHSDYLDVLEAELHKKQRVPAFYLAVWLYRNEDWPRHSTSQDIITTFFEDFHITFEEGERLFDTSIPDISPTELFQEAPISERQLTRIIGLPPDAPREAGGTLSYLHLDGIGPATELSLDLGERVNLLTGDNGLGKTFILECAWWALTGAWASLPAEPRDDTNQATITFAVAGRSLKPTQAQVAFDWQLQNWPIRPEHETLPGLSLYVRADNSFALWDPARHYQASSAAQANRPRGPFLFNWRQVWDGLEIEERGKVWHICNGLITDWIYWQSTPEEIEFGTLTDVLACLSPMELVLKPGTPRRLPMDSRIFPTLSLPYGNVPVVYLAAGMRRIVALAYLIVWAWTEHKVQSELARREPLDRMVVLIDEVEAHLHPRWQRLILPALLSVQSELDPELEIQFIVATHSPLVMASMEPIFDEAIDRMFHLDLVQMGLLGSEVNLSTLPFVKYGTVDSLLTSEIFELGSPRSVDAERAIERAKELQIQETPNSEKIKEVHETLVKILAADDEFWPRWLYFAEQHGVRV